MTMMANASFSTYGTGVDDEIHEPELVVHEAVKTKQPVPSRNKKNSDLVADIMDDFVVSSLRFFLSFAYSLQVDSP